MPNNIFNSTVLKHLKTETVLDDLYLDDQDVNHADKDISSNLFTISRQIFNLNGLVDVLVYCIFDKEFRSALKDLFTCKAKS